MDINIDELIEYIKIALQQLYEKDKYLFECDVKEEDLVFHFARYFINVLEQKKFDLKKYSVDVEYNRNIFNEDRYKDIMYGNERKKIIPDLLLHQRGSNENNIIAFEFKKKNTKKVKDDIFKLKALTNNSLEYKYRLGILIIFKHGYDYLIKIIKNGEEEQ